MSLPSIDPGTGRPQGSVTPVTVSFPALSGDNVRLTVDAVAPHNFLDYESENTNTDPVGLAEIAIPGVADLATPSTGPGTLLRQPPGDRRAARRHLLHRGYLGGLDQPATQHPKAAETPRTASHSRAGRHVLTTATWAAVGLNVDTLGPRLGSRRGAPGAAGRRRTPRPAPPLVAAREGAVPEPRPGDREGARVTARGSGWSSVRARAGGGRPP